MPQQLIEILGELGLTQYRDAFVEQGFDTWDTILDITESDMDALGVKLGHRRKLQRRIAKFRGVGPEIALVSPTRTTSEEAKTDAPSKEQPSSFQDSRGAVPGVLAKRKYRRHPKADECAPERPPSAYVLFSNKMREDLKGKNLSFTEIAKLVGEKWQSLPPSEREPFETQAQLAKDKYNHDLAEYKKTPDYQKYLVYLQEFKAKYAYQTQDKEAFKRIKLSEFGNSSDAQAHTDTDANANSPPTPAGAGASATASASYHRQQQRAHMGVLRAHGSRSGSESLHEHEHEETDHDHDHDHEDDHDENDHHDSPRTNDSRKRRIGSTVSASDSHFSDSPTPGPIHSPIQPSDHLRRSPHSHPRSMSPRDVQKPSPTISRRADRSNASGNGHVSLPSLSDMFDNRQLSPTSLAPPTAKPEAANYHGGSASASGGTSPGIPPHGMAASISSTSNGSASSYSTNGYPRTPMDGSLPIHALLSDKATGPPQPQSQSQPQPPSQAQSHHQYQQSHHHHQHAPQYQAQHQHQQYPNQHPSHASHSHQEHHQEHRQHQHHAQHHAPHPQHTHHPHPSQHAPRRGASPRHSPPPQAWPYPPAEHHAVYTEHARPPTGGAYPSYS